MKQSAWSGYCSLWNFGKMVLPGVALLLLAGCRSAPAEKVVAIPEALATWMEPGESDEFDLRWTDDDAIRKFHKIRLKVDFAAAPLENSWWDRVNIVYLFDNDGERQEQLIDYAHRSLCEAFAKSDCLTLVDKADPEAMILHFVIVQVVPNKPVLGALNNLSSLTPFGAMAIPVKMTLHSLTPSSGGAIAAEAMLTDSSGEVYLGAMADRAKAPTAFFSVRAFTPWWNIEKIIDRWSESIAAGLDDIERERTARFTTAPGFAWIN